MNLSNMTEEEKAQRRKDYSKAYRLKLEEERRQMRAEKLRQGKLRKSDLCLYGKRSKNEEISN